MFHQRCSGKLMADSIILRISPLQDVVDNSTNFEQKCHRVIGTLLNRLGLDDKRFGKNINKHKFLIDSKFSLVSQSEIIQTLIHFTQQGVSVSCSIPGLCRGAHLSFCIRRWLAVPYSSTHSKFHFSLQFNAASVSATVQSLVFSERT